MTSTAIAAPAVLSGKPAEVGHFIDGRKVFSARPAFENRNPATGEVVSLVHEADAALVDDAVQAARRALKGPYSSPCDFIARKLGPFSQIRSTLPPLSRPAPFSASTRVTASEVSFSLTCRSVTP